jgi:hypothetical protein
MGNTVRAASEPAAFSRQEAAVNPAPDEDGEVLCAEALDTISKCRDAAEAIHLAAAIMARELEMQETTVLKLLQLLLRYEEGGRR